MLAILEHWSASTETFPSCARLALFTSLSERTVKSALAGLERSKFINVERSNGRSNRYDLNPVFELKASATIARVSKSKPVQPLHGSTSATVASIKNEPVQPLPPTGATIAPEPVQPLPPKRSIEEIQLRDHLSSGNQTTQLQRHYTEIFKQRKGIEPSWGPKDYGRVNKYFKDLIEALGGDLSKAKQIVTTALLDEWNSRIKPHEIFADRDKWLGEEPRTKTRANRRSEPQHGVADHVQVASFDDADIAARQAMWDEADRQERETLLQAARLRKTESGQPPELKALIGGIG